jgi:hypothetical protein
VTTDAHEAASLRTQKIIWYVTGGILLLALFLVKAFGWISALIGLLVAGGFGLNAFLMIRTRVGYGPGLSGVVRGRGAVFCGAGYLIFMGVLIVGAILPIIKHG